MYSTSDGEYQLDGNGWVITNNIESEIFHFGFGLKDKSIYDKVYLIIQKTGLTVALNYTNSDKTLSVWSIHVYPANTISDINIE